MFRRILAAGMPLDQIEIGCASDAHLTLIWEKALRHNWPVTLGAGVPATFTRPGRALLGLFDWVETDFSAGYFRRLLQSGDVSVAKDEGFTAGQAARTIARAGAGWGRATYELSLSSLHRSYEARAHDRDESDADRAVAHERAMQVDAVTYPHANRGGRHTVFDGDARREMGSWEEMPAAAGCAMIDEGGQPSVLYVHQGRLVFTSLQGRTIRSVAFSRHGMDRAAQRDRVAERSRGRRGTRKRIPPEASRGSRGPHVQPDRVCGDGR